MAAETNNFLEKKMQINGRKGTKHNCTGSHYTCVLHREFSPVFIEKKKKFELEVKKAIKLKLKCGN